MAKRKSIKRKRRPSATRRGKSKQLPTWVFIGIGVLVGLFVGGLIQLVINRTNAPDSGIRALFESSKQQEKKVALPDKSKKIKQSKPKYDFYTILPEIEVVIPEGSKEPLRTTKTGENLSYVLQAGSFARFEDADRLKAALALSGLLANIQKVSIENRGEFHRVRLGPYRDYAQLQKSDAQLRSMGIKALRLKIRNQP